MANGGTPGAGNTSTPLGTITSLFGLLAGAATLVYVTGAMIMALRLAFNDLPNPTAVASRLSREVLIAVGLTFIAGPALLIFLIYVGSRLTALDDAGGLPGNGFRNSWRNAVIWGLISCLPGLYWAAVVSHYDRSDLWQGVIAFILATIIIRVTLSYQVWIRRRNAKGELRGRPLVLALGLVWALTAIPALVIFGAAVRFQPVLVCGVAGQLQREGFLVGETDDRIYVGEDQSDVAVGQREPRLLIIPFAAVDEMFVGPDASGATCQVSTPPTPSDEIHQGRTQ